MSSSDIAKVSDVSDDVREIPHSRSVAFPADTAGDHDHYTKGVGHRHDLMAATKDTTKVLIDGDIDEAKGLEDDSKGDDFKNVDISEHGLPFSSLAEELQTSFDPKDPSKSFGLQEGEAKARLEREGKNVLSPPKKTSALRLVSF